LSLEEGEGMGKAWFSAWLRREPMIVDINKDTANKVANEVKALGRKSLAVEADATDNKQIDHAVQKVIDNFDVPKYSLTANITIAAG